MVQGKGFRVVHPTQLLTEYSSGFTTVAERATSDFRILGSDFRFLNMDSVLDIDILKILNMLFIGNISIFSYSDRFLVIIL